MGAIRACRSLLVALVSLVALGAGGCARPGDRGDAAGVGAAVEGVSYEQIVRSWNERSALLERVWARAAVSLSWTDDRGRSRYEQGRGHLQLVQPSRLALSINKLGEVLFWFGADEERYWLIDRGEPRSAVVGRRGLLSFERMRALGMPATPDDLAAMTGALPLPELPRGDAPAIVRSDAARGAVRFELREGWRTLRYHIDPARMVPVRVELVDDAGVVVAVADQEVYGGVVVEGHGGNLPLFPSRLRVRHLESGSTLTLTMEEMSSRAPGGAISDAAFDFEVLLDRLGVRDVIDLDAVESPGAEEAGAVDVVGVR